MKFGKFVIKWKAKQKGNKKIREEQILYQFTREIDIATM
jgi:hypothetical protein